MDNNFSCKQFRKHITIGFIIFLVLQFILHYIYNDTSYGMLIYRIFEFIAIISALYYIFCKIKKKKSV